MVDENMDFNLDMDSLQRKYLMMQGVKLDEEYNMYFDETNNCRKFWLQHDDQFNVDIAEDFLLGGVAYKGSRPDVNLEYMKDILHLQPSVKELKFSKLFSKGDFLNCINSSRVIDFLDWLDNTGMYIHYIDVNNLYYAIADIVDSIVNLRELEAAGLDYFELKSEFYYSVIKQDDELKHIMYKYKFPNVGNASILDFYDELKQMIEKSKEYQRNSIYVDYITDEMFSGKPNNFLQGNSDFIMQDNYIEFYLQPIYTYRKSQLVFDEEYEIQKIFHECNFVNEKVVVDNYCFKSSTFEIMIQISDVIVGLYGKLISMLNRYNEEKITNTCKNLNERQRKAVKLLGKLRDKSSRENRGFITTIAPKREHEKLNMFIELA